MYPNSMFCAALLLLIHFNGVIFTSAAKLPEIIPLVQIDQGQLRGRYVVLGSGESYYSFQGIPYAKAPVDLLRFKMAQKPDSWNGIRNALEEGPSCPQVNWLLNLPYSGHENCLFLNIYSPQLPSVGENLKYPVMVWIHGGRFDIGSGDTSMYGPQYLVSESVVLVTMNYRLGALGFLSVEDESHPENLGLKDQAFALRWVKENIDNFGGDPQNVLLFGHASGAAAINFHLVSPMSKGLFHKVILQSGCALNSWAISKRPKELANALGEELHCPNGNVHDLLQCLQDVSARGLVEAYYQILKNQTVGQRTIFAPTLEDAYSKMEMFLPPNAEELLESGKFHSVPSMIGLNSKEGIFILQMNGILKKPENLKILGEKLENQIPSDVVSLLNPQEIAAKIKEFYFHNKSPEEFTMDEFVDLSTDAWFLRGLDKLANILAENSSPVFFYNFDFSGTLNVYKHFVQASNFSGAAHLDLLGYMFKTKFFNVSDVLPDSPEWITRKRVVKMWTNFAKTGNPTPSIDFPIDVTWPTYSMDGGHYINISKSLSIGKNLHEERIAFWNNL